MQPKEKCAKNMFFVICLTQRLKNSTKLDLRKQVSMQLQKSTIAFFITLAFKYTEITS